MKRFLPLLFILIGLLVPLSQQVEAAGQARTDSALTKQACSNRQLGYRRKPPFNHTKHQPKAARQSVAKTKLPKCPPSMDGVHRRIKDDHYDYDDNGHYHSGCYYLGTHIPKPCTPARAQLIYNKDCYYLGTRILRKQCAPICYIVD